MNLNSKAKLLVFFTDSNAQNRSLADNFCSQLEKIFPGITFESSFVSHHEDYFKDISQLRIPHLAVFMDGTKTNTLEQLAPTLNAFRNLDPNIVLARITKTPPSGKESLAWLEAGLSALIGENIHYKELSDHFKELLNLRLEHHVARPPRIPSKHKISLHIASLEQAVVSETINLGTGGMFIRIVPPDIHVGDLVEFELLFGRELSQKESSHSPDPLGTDPHPLDEKTKLPLSGTGSVVWIRPTADNTQLPEGLGIKFQELSKEAALQINSYINTHRIRTVVPKS